MLRVEITGPTDRKMVINALNSGAKTFMADLEGESNVELEPATQGVERLEQPCTGEQALINLIRLDFADMVQRGPRTKEPARRYQVSCFSLSSERWITGSS